MQLSCAAGPRVQRQQLEVTERAELLEQLLHVSIPHKICLVCYLDNWTPTLGKLGGISGRFWCLKTECVCSERVYSESVCYGHYCDSGCSDQALNPFIRIFLLFFFMLFKEIVHPNLLHGFRGVRGHQMGLLPQQTVIKKRNSLRNPQFTPTY